MNSPEAFWDSSALVPLVVRQPVSVWAKTMSGRFNITVWWVATVEVDSAIARLRREVKLNRVEVDLAKRIVGALKEEWQEISPSDEVRDKASALLDRYALRAADSLQLAAALVWCRDRPKSRPFLCADGKLAESAEQVGFTVHRP